MTGLVLMSGSAIVDGLAGSSIAGAALCREEDVASLATRLLAVAAIFQLLTAVRLSAWEHCAG